MEVDYHQLKEAEENYYTIIGGMPPKLMMQMPKFFDFLCSVGHISFTNGWGARLSKREERRFRAIMGPHAATLLRAYALKKLPK